RKGSWIIQKPKRQVSGAVPGLRTKRLTLDHRNLFAVPDFFQVLSWITMCFIGTSVCGVHQRSAQDAFDVVESLSQLIAGHRKQPERTLVRIIPLPGDIEERVGQEEGDRS